LFGWPSQVADHRFVLSQEPYNYNTRAAGIVDDYALVPVDEVLLNWLMRSYV